MKKLLWVDLEMTGLDEKKERILEIAAQVTDFDLREVSPFFDQVVFQAPEILSQMDAWCQKTHGESGLTALVPNGLSEKAAEEALLKFLDAHFEAHEKIVLAGNSIWNDRKFIDLYLPRFAQRLHYRMVDVSSFKEILKTKGSIQFHKSNTHRAKEDILESIEELKFYLSFIQWNAPTLQKQSSLTEKALQAESL